MSEGLKHLKQYGTGAGGSWARPGRGGLWYRYTVTDSDSVSLTDRQMTFCVSC